MKTKLHFRFSIRKTGSSFTMPIGYAAVPEEVVAAGGRIIGGTDDPSSGIAGLTLHMEMAMMVESGSHAHVKLLQSVTGWSAALLNGRRKTASIRR